MRLAVDLLAIYLTTGCFVVFSMLSLYGPEITARMREDFERRHRGRWSLAVATWIVLWLPMALAVLVAHWRGTLPEIARDFRRQYLDSEKWQNVLADPEPPQLFSGPIVVDFTWGPASEGATCEAWSPQAVERMRTASEVRAMPLCGAPAVVATTTIYSDGSTRVVPFCKACQPFRGIDAEFEPDEPHT